MRTLIKRRQGAAMLVNLIVMGLMMAVMASSIAMLSGAQFSSAEAHRQFAEAYQLAEIKANEISVVNYDNQIAETRAVIEGASAWQREVILGDPATLTNQNAYREVTVNVYYGNESTARASIKKYPVLRARELSIGTVIAWYGTAANIPYGWALCTGANGTPDLRNRFVVGAGGSYAVGNSGGEASHRLTLSEMPSHMHGLSIFNAGGGVYDVAMPTGGTLGYSDVPGTNFWYGLGAGTDYSGGDQPHNNLPPYYGLLYLMRTI